MMQKVVVGLLILTVFGAVAIGIYDAAQSDELAGASALLSEETQIVNNTLTVTQTPVVPAPAVQSADEVAQPVQQQQALTEIGEVWHDSGMIAAFDTNGMYLTGTLAGEIYVELGPATYWQEQPVTLSVGETVSVDGFYNGDQYHAVAVTKTDGTQLVVRTIDGLPLWSGGANNGNGNQGQQAQGEPVQGDPIDWITLEGVVADVQGSNLTMQTNDAQHIALQLGQKNFIESQGITFAAGDEITVVGYWQGEQFKAGEITKTATGERLMLLDPNGRPLWGGPGRNGAQGQNNSQNATDTGSTNPQTLDNTSSNTGNGRGGNGKGYQGGRNQTENQDQAG